MRIVSVLENKKLEKRIAITPEIVKKYISIGIEVCLCENYANHLGIDDKEYQNIGVEIKKDGTIDSIRSRLVNAILQNETLKTYASFAVTASTQMMRLRNMNTTASEKVNAQTKMAIKRELEMDLSREVSNACWNELAEKDGDIARAVQKEIFRERKMRYDLKEEKILKRKKMKKTKKVGGRLARGGR